MKSNNSKKLKKVKVREKTHLYIPKSDRSIDMEGQMNYQKFLDVLTQIIMKYSE